MRALAAAAVSAVGSGRFLTPWSIAATLPLSLTVMAPLGEGIDLRDALPAVIATWICFAAGLTLVAAAQRPARGTRTRAAVVVMGLLLCGALRPAVQDAWLHLGGVPTPSADQLAFRIATNVVVWTVVLSVVAVLEQSLRSLRRTNRLLRSVLAALSQAQERARAFTRDARRLLDESTADLTRAIDGLGKAPADVRRLGDEHLRVWSHRLAAFAEAGARGGPDHPDGLDHDRDLHRGEEDHPTVLRRRALFRTPPRGVVAVLSAVCLLPYALRTQAPLDLLIGLVVLVVGGAIADAIPRRRAFAGNPRGANRLFVMLSAALGLALAGLAVVQGAAPVLAFVSAIAYLGFALAAGSCTGALHSLRREQQRLSSTVAAAQRAARAGIRPASEGLRGVAELLHRDAQGACVVFALAHPAPAPSALQGLQHDLSAVVRRMPRVFTAAHSHGSQVSLTGLFDTWAQVIDLRVDIDDASRVALQNIPWLAHDCYDVVAEGLLNAAKHATERWAAVSLHRVATGAGPQLRVRVSSVGGSAPDTGLRSSARTHELGARLLSDAGGVVLEAAFPLPPVAAVVSAEHQA